MERLQLKHDNVIIFMILLVILFLIKSILYYISLTKFKHIIVSDDHFEKFRNILSDFLDALLLFVSLFILFLRENNSQLIIFLAIIFLFKAILHFIAYYKLYKYMNLNQNEINDIEKTHKIVSFVTNTMLFVISFYMLKIIFINK
jgi:hypothetical protein